MTDLEDIKSKIDLVDYIGKSVELKKAGQNYKGLCPFHGEKSPSFTVSADKQIWHCFGCGRGGDVFKFVMEKEGVEFVEALKMLAEQVGVTLTNAPRGETDEKKSLLALNEWGAKVFEKSLAESSEGRAAKQYLLDRGLTPATIEKFRLGWSPANGRALAEVLTRRGYSPELIEKAGLGSLKGKYVYDKFVGRVMFPLADVSGRIVGFTGRVLANQIPKYLNSPETAIFHKSEMLYALHLAKSAIQQARQVVLVEGQMDTISSHQAGVENTVGISGTALTETQLQLLSRYADEIVLALDADSAGGEATKRAIELAGRFDMRVKIIASFGDHKDPGELIKEDPEEWKKAVEGAASIMDFYFESLASKYDLQTLEGKKSTARELLPVIGKLSDPMDKDHYIKRLGRMVGVDPVVLYDTLKTVKPSRSSAAKVSAPTLPVSSISQEESVAVLPLVYPGLAKAFVEQSGKIKWASSLTNIIYDRLLSWYNAGNPLDIDAVLASIGEPDKTSILELMLVVEQDYAGIELPDIEREMISQLSHMTSKSYGEKRADLARQIAQAEQDLDERKKNELLAELNGL